MDGPVTKKTRMSTSTETSAITYSLDELTNMAAKLPGVLRFECEWDDGFCLYAYFRLPGGEVSIRIETSELYKHPCDGDGEGVTPDHWPVYDEPTETFEAPEFWESFLDRDHAFFKEEMDHISGGLACRAGRIEVYDDNCADCVRAHARVSLPVTDAIRAAFHQVADWLRANPRPKSDDEEYVEPDYQRDRPWCCCGKVGGIHRFVPYKATVWKHVCDQLEDPNEVWNALVEGCGERDDYTIAEFQQYIDCEYLNLPLLLEKASAECD